MLEGRQFKIFTDQKPLTSAFFKARNPVSSRQQHQLAVISEYCTDVAHVPGLDNVVADALSRQHEREEDENKKAQKCTAAVHAVAHLMADIDLEKLALEQQNPPSAEEHPSLVLQHLNVPGCSQKLWCDTSQGRLRFLVPPTWRQKIFSSLHELSHPSGKASLAIVARSYVWNGMRKDILSWARSCQVCARSKVARHTKPPVQPIDVPATRFDHVHVDLVGPFQRDQDHRYILTMIDRTTCWPEAVAIKDATTDTVLQVFIHTWIAWFGIPRTVTSDRGRNLHRGRGQVPSPSWASPLHLPLRTTPSQMAW